MPLNTATTLATLMESRTPNQTASARRRLRIYGLSDDECNPNEDEEDEEKQDRAKPPKKRKLLVAEFEQLVRSVMNQELGAEQALISLLKQDPTMASTCFGILDNKQKAYPLFHLAQVGSLQAVIQVYSLYPQAIRAKTKSGYTPHHFAAGSRNDDVLRFLVLQHPHALTAKPSILHMLCERITNGVVLIQFCLNQCPSALMDLDNGGTLLHKACNIPQFPYPGPRPQLISYLLDIYPQACEMGDHDGHLPLHVLLDHAPEAPVNQIPTDVALLLIERFPKSLEIPNNAGCLPLELAMDNGASAELLLAMQQSYPDADVLPEPHHAQVMQAYLQQLNTTHLMHVKVWDQTCQPLARGIAGILRQASSQFTQLTIAYTRFEKTGMVLVLNALADNRDIKECVLTANIGFYAYKVGLRDLAPEFPPDVHSEVQLGQTANNLDLSRALSRLLGQNSSIEMLDLADNQLPQDPTWLYALMNNTTLRRLNLNRIGLGNNILRALIPVIRHNRVLTELNLECPTIHESALIELLQTVLSETTTLAHVTFHGPSELLMQTAIQTLKTNPFLQHVVFRWYNRAHSVRSGQDLLVELGDELEYRAKLNRAGRYRKFGKNNFMSNILPNIGQVPILYGLIREVVTELF